MVMIRAMFVGQGGSLLPEDRFVNTLHFYDPTLIDFESAALDIHPVIESFYSTSTPGGNSVSNFISAYVGRNAQVVYYNLGDPPPRVPFPIGLLLDDSVGTGLPEEVAICLSFAGAPPVTPRRRGRIFIGPLTNSAEVLDGATIADPARPAMGSAPYLAETLAFAADRMIDEATTAGVPWCIRSTVPTQNFVPVVSGWVDNAFDTQRRRGVDPTGRLTFGL